jgi:hypothetical protein
MDDFAKELILVCIAVVLASALFGCVSWIVWLGPLEEERKLKYTGCLSEMNDQDATLCLQNRIVDLENQINATGH